MPVVGASTCIPRPIGAFRVDEDDARASVLLVVVGPNIEVAARRSRLCVPGSLKPRVLVGGVVDLKIDDDAYIAGMRRADELTEIGERSIVGMNVAIAADIVTVVKSRRSIEWQDPYDVHAEIGNIVQF